MTIQFVTGTDAAMFAQTFILMQSLEETGATHHLTVCDFGMTSLQRRFLETRGQLATIPTLPKERQHPWYYKSALIDFIGHKASTAVWLDADTMVMTDPGPAVESLVADMNASGHTVAACQDTPSMDIAGIVQFWMRTGHDCTPFIQRLRQWNIRPQHEYLNSGFFIVNSRRWLKDWKRLTFETAPYFLFEQSAFNVVAWRSPNKVRILDAREWNLHGDALGRISFEDDGQRALCDGRRVVVVHATSLGERHHEVRVESWEISGVTRSDTIKAFRNRRLREMQSRLFRRFVTNNERVLAACWAGGE